MIFTKYFDIMANAKKLPAFFFLSDLTWNCPRAMVALQLGTFATHSTQSLSNSLHIKLIIDGKKENNAKVKLSRNKKNEKPAYLPRSHPPIVHPVHYSGLEGGGPPGQDN